MSRKSPPERKDGQQLILFVAGDSPRSRRARSNLASALEDVGMTDIRPREIDLLQEPDQAVTHGLLATPALLLADEERFGAVLYGDLSDHDSLMRFLVPPAS